MEKERVWLFLLTFYRSKGESIYNTLESTGIIKSQGPKNVGKNVYLKVY